MSGSEKTSSTMATPTDWTLCALCQEHSENEPLRDASRASNQSSPDVYETLAQNLISLNDLGIGVTAGGGGGLGGGARAPHLKLVPPRCPPPPPF